jgi:hypothetical protein
MAGCVRTAKMGRNEHNSLVCEEPDYAGYDLQVRNMRLV